MKSLQKGKLYHLTPKRTFSPFEDFKKNLKVLLYLGSRIDEQGIKTLVFLDRDGEETSFLGFDCGDFLQFDIPKKKKMEEGS